jgi:hypothetical protein
VFYREKGKKPGFSEESAQSAQITVDSFFNYLYYLPQTAPIDTSCFFATMDSKTPLKECAIFFSRMSITMPILLPQSQSATGPKVHSERVGWVSCLFGGGV